MIPDYKSTPVYVAEYLGYNPSVPESWPHRLIDRLLSVLKYKGETAFAYEVHQLYQGNSSQTCRFCKQYT